VPKIYREFSSKRVVTMSFEEGVSINNLQAIKQMGIDFKDLTRLITKFCCEQIFEHGFVHCDPHPGF
jgi:predicted unusual protein kinase regulating ubiquinone biosynthesis (AarF/ABC1/UbiB family)